MVDGNITTKLGLKAIANQLANEAGTIDTIYYDEVNKTYFIEEITEEILLNNGFEFFTRGSNFKPIYKKGDIFAEPNTDPAFGSVMLYKESSSRWVGEE